MTLAPPAWSAIELDVFRGGFALAFLWSFDVLHRTVRHDSFSHPQGWAGLVPLRVADHALIRRALPSVTWVAVIAYLLARGTAVALGVLSVVIVVEVTRDNSDGGGGHRHHLLATVTVVQWIAALAWWVADGRGAVFAASRDATLAWWTVQAIVAVYFVSGVEKLIRTGGRWVQRSPGLLVRALSVQTAAQMRPSARKRRAAVRAEGIVGWMLPRPWLTRLVFGVGLLAELAAPVGLFGENQLLVVGLVLLGLHAANGVLLGLPFAMWQLLVVVYMVNPARILG